MTSGGPNARISMAFTGREVSTRTQSRPSGASTQNLPAVRIRDRPCHTHRLHSASATVNRCPTGGPAIAKRVATQPQTLRFPCGHLEQQPSLDARLRKTPRAAWVACRGVAKDLIANDEPEISEVVRRQLFQDLGSQKIRKNVAKAFGDWCFERRAQLPPEWTAVDTAATEAKAREFLCGRFEACYPFHPATLSVFQRKWQALPQYQQTRGTLAMLAQWVAIAAQESFRKARTEPLITLGSAPLSEPGFRSVVLGQLGESRLVAAIDTDIAGEQSHAKALDADTKGPLRDIYRRVGAAILFESSGGQTDKVAHLPELRFALCEPDVDTTSIDNAAFALEGRSYFIRKAGSDGFRIGYQPTMKKVVSDRGASLDDETEVKPTLRKLVEDEFRRGASIPGPPLPARALGRESFRNFGPARTSRSESTSRWR
jgi:hypothetical protein